MTAIEWQREAQRLRAEAETKFNGYTAAGRVWSEEEEAECVRLHDEATQAEREASREETARASRSRSVEAFRDRVTSGRPIDDLTSRRSDSLAHNDPRNARGHTGRRHEFSVLRAAELYDAGRRFDGIEAEVIDDISTRSETPIRGFPVPWDLEVHPRHMSPSTRRALLREGWSFRDIDTTTAAGVVATVTLPTLIDVLRARMLTATLGVMILEGLQGKLAIPQKTAAAGFGWIAEGSTRTPDNMTVASVPMEPRSVIGSTVISRKLMKQASFSAEQMARMDLMDGLAVELDRVGLNGSGTGAQPRGILQTAGVSSIDFGAAGAGTITWAKIVEFERTVDVANGLQGSLAYVTTPAARGKAKTVIRDAGSGLFVWADDNTMNGYPAYATTNMPANLTETASNLSGMIFGNFEDACYGLWGPIDLIPNPYAGDTGGSLRLTIIQDADFVPRRNASFARALDISTL